MDIIILVNTNEIIESKVLNVKKSKKAKIKLNIEMAEDIKSMKMELKKDRLKNFHNIYGNVN